MFVSGTFLKLTKLNMELDNSTFKFLPFKILPFNVKVFDLFKMSESRIQVTPRVFFWGARLGTLEMVQYLKADSQMRIIAISEFIKLDNSPWENKLWKACNRDTVRFATTKHFTYWQPYFACEDHSVTKTSIKNVTGAGDIVGFHCYAPPCWSTRAFFVQ